MMGFSVTGTCGHGYHVCAGSVREWGETHVEAAPRADGGQQAAVDPVDDRTVVLAWPAETIQVLMHVGDKQIVALQHTMWVQQRQGVGEAGGRPVADVH